MLMSIVGGRVCSSCLRFSLLLLFLLAYVHVCYSVPPICVDLTGELDEDTDLTLNPFSVATDADGNIDVASTVLLTPPDRGRREKEIEERGTG